MSILFWGFVAGTIMFIITMLLVMALKRFIANRVIGFVVGLVVGGAGGFRLGFLLAGRALSGAGLPGHSVGIGLLVIFWIWGIACVGGVIGGLVGADNNVYKIEQAAKVQALNQNQEQINP